MATDKEQRTIEIILKAQEANASLKEMGAGAAVMTAQLGKMGKDDPGRAKLENDLRGINQRLTEARANTRGLTDEQQAQSAELVRVIVNGHKVAASYNEIEAAAKRLEAELKDLPAGTEAFIKKSKELDSVQERMEEVNEEMKGSQKSSLMAALGLDGITSASGLMKAGFQAAMSALLPLLAIQQIWELVKAFAGVVQEVDEVRAAVNTATGATGEMLDTLTIRARALTMTFGVDYKDALKGVDVMAKQMGFTHVEAFDLMEKGYLAGADRSEELIDNIKEYSVQFKAAGYSAEEMMEYLTKAELGGVFSDKGADVVKEFGQRIREQTVATSDAMDAAFGKKFTDRIFKGINDGSMTTKEALEEVSKAMNNTAIPASKLQTVVADVFGGPGEDAGTAYLQSLYKVGQGMDSLIDKTNDYTRLQSELLDSNKWLAEEQEKLAVNFTGAGTTLSVVWNKLQALVYAQINTIVEGMSQLSWAAQGSIATLKAWARDFVEAFDSLAYADWKGAKKALASMGHDGAEAYSTAYNAAKERSHQNQLAIENDRNKAKREADKAAADAAAKDKFEGDAKTRKEQEVADKAAEKQRLADAKKHAADLKKAREEAAKAALATEQALEDLRVGLIKDKHEREIQEINLQTNRKMAAIKGSAEQQQEQWELLEQERQEKIAAVREKQAEDEATKRDADLAKKNELQAADDELFLAGLQNRVALGLATEQQYQDKLYQLQQEALAVRLQQLVDAGQGEGLEAKKVRAALLKGQAEYAAGVRREDTQLQKDAKAMSRITRALQNEDLDFLMGTLDKKGLAYMAFKNIRKTAELADIGINLAAEIQQIWKYSNENPLNGITGGAAGTVVATVQTGLAVARAASAGARIAAYAEGGRTDQLVNFVSPAMLANLMTGPSGGSFAGGGVVPGPQLGLIGEAGAELVIPNWLFSDPKQANLMGYLEAQIASRGNAFADGGRTADRASGVVVGPDAEPAGDTMLGLLERIAKGQEAFRDEISTWQREQEVRIDLFKVREGLDTMQQVKTGGGLK